MTCSFMEDYLDLLGVDEWNEEAMKMCKAQGQEKIRNMLIEKSLWFEALYKEIKSMLVD